jgi:hypothetical protein
LTTSELDVTIDLPLAGSKFRKDKTIAKLESVSEVSVDAVSYTIDESYLSKLFFRDWKRGDFASAFAELNAASLGIATIDITDAVHRIESEEVASQRDISILGLSIPVSELSRWGALLLVSVQLYFWLHLHELVIKIEPSAEGWDVAWIGLYRTKTAFAAALISACLIPVSAAAALAHKIVTIEIYYHKTAIMASVLIVILSGLISIFTARKLYNLRRNMIKGNSPTPALLTKRN